MVRRGKEQKEKYILYIYTRKKDRGRRIKYDRVKSINFKHDLSKELCKQKLINTHNRERK